MTVPNPRGRKPLRYHLCRRMVTIAEQSARDLVSGERRVLKRYVPTAERNGVEILDIQRTAMNRTRSIHQDSLKAQDAAA